MTTSLDLGCGDKPRNPFDAGVVYGIDLLANPQNLVSAADLALEPIPFSESYFDFVTAYDFLEHVPRLIFARPWNGGAAQVRRYPFVDLMSEIWRVLKLGGKFLSHTLAYPHALAFRDPTYVNIITEETFSLYFDATHCMARRYGFKGGFYIETQTWQVPWLVTIMEKRR